MVVGFGKVVETYRGLTPEKSMCFGCHDDFYNDRNPFGVKECWHFKDARVVDALFYPGTWATDADQVMKRTLSCYRG